MITKNKFFLAALCIAIGTNSFAKEAGISTNAITIEQSIQQLENSFAGRIGVYAINTNNNQIIAHRANELFPIQSTMKMIGVAALLRQSTTKPHLLQEKIYYTQNDLMAWAPVTRHNLTSGMSLEDLAEAAITYSDNAAINIILKRFGGTKFAIDFARSIGNQSYNVSHYDGYMNSNPKNSDDTATPKDMAVSVQKLIVGDALAKAQKQQLLSWMRNTVTSYHAMRYGVPIGFAVADKTGSGDYGIRNDIGIIWSPACKPIILAIYTARNNKNAAIRDDIVAKTTSLVVDSFAKRDACFREF